MRTWLAIGAIALSVSTAPAQTPGQSSDQPRFDVASMKVNITNDGIVFDTAQKGRYTIYGYTLARLIRSAYRSRNFRSSADLTG
jgi:hypothetical protein